MSSTHTTTAQLRQQVFAASRTGFKKVTSTPKSTTIAAYAGVFLLVMSVVAIGYQPPQNMESVANAAQTPAVTAPAATQPSVDQIVATNVAAGIAERAELPVATNIANLSVSLSAESQLAQNDANAITKPQIIQPTADSREMKSYTAKAGDTVDLIARQFNVSPNTIKWANNLNSDAVEAGRQLTIPPVDGIVYTAKAGDTVDTIASKYKADKERVVAFNDLEFGGLAEGKKIIIPAGSLPEEERPGYVAPRGGSRQGVSSGGYVVGNIHTLQASAGNRYAGGNCTWWAFERRAQLGRPIGSFWGNASTWAMNARAAGFTVNRTPAPGAVAHWNAYQGGSYGAGHVAIVESVNSDGSITISEMNYLGNYNRRSERTIDPGMVSNFIH
jgi:N-acetylmuramoyl-L-alanine amidase